MKKILVTGLIGSGKSAVCSILQQKGYPVYDSDSRAKALYRRKDFSERLEKEIGIKISELGSVFSDRQKLSELEAIVHPAVLEDFNAEAVACGADVIFFESAIAGSFPLFRDAFDLTILVRSDREKRWQRNVKAKTRDAFQSEPQRYDFLIENNGSIDDLEKKIDLIINQL